MQYKEFEIQVIKYNDGMCEAVALYRGKPYHFSSYYDKKDEQQAINKIKKLIDFDKKPKC